MRVLIVSHIRCLREAIQAGLVGKGFRGHSEVLSTSTINQVTFDLAPDLILVSCPAPEGIELLSSFRLSYPSTRVAVLACCDSHDDFFAWARFGISGYIESDAGMDDIASIVLRLTTGEIIYPARLSGALLSQFARQPVQSTERSMAAEQSLVGLLTHREMTVLELVADGLSNKQIARRLSIADATVKNHVHSVLEKMAVDRRGVAAAWFRRLPARDGGRDERGAARVALGSPATAMDRMSLPTHAALLSSRRPDGLVHAHRGGSGVKARSSAG